MNSPLGTIADALQRIAIRLEAEAERHAAQMQESEKYRERAKRIQRLYAEFYMRFPGLTECMRLLPHLSEDVLDGILECKDPAQVCNYLARADKPLLLRLNTVDRDVIRDELERLEERLSLAPLAPV